jgi:putative S-layer-RTX protein
MASIIGVVKSVSDKNAKVVNNLTKEERALNVGDILFQNDTIISDDANFKVEVAKVGGADKVFTGKRVDLTNFADDSSNAQSSDNDEIASLQQAILKGENLTNLEETAAGGNQAGGNASDGGVSLGAASFAQGGHYSNINANFQNLSDISRGDVPSVRSVSGYANAGASGTARPDEIEILHVDKEIFAKFAATELEIANIVKARVDEAKAKIEAAKNATYDNETFTKEYSWSDKKMPDGFLDKTNKAVATNHLDWMDIKNTTNDNLVDLRIGGREFALLGGSSGNNVVLGGGDDIAPGDPFVDDTVALGNASGNNIVSFETNDPTFRASIESDATSGDNTILSGGSRLNAGLYAVSGHNVVDGSHSSSIEVKIGGRSYSDAGSAWGINDKDDSFISQADNTVLGSDNADYVSFINAAGNNLIDLAGGDDEVFISDRAGGTNATIYLGDGDDVLSAGPVTSYYTNVRQNLNIDAGAGNDEIITISKQGTYHINGGSGDDTIIMSANNFNGVVDGGEGYDTLKLATQGQAETIDFRALANGELDAKINNIEEISFDTRQSVSRDGISGDGSGVHIKNINAQDVLDITDDKDVVLKFTSGNTSGNSLSLDGFSVSSDQSGAQAGYTRYESKLVRVLNDDTGELSAPMTVKIDIENTITVDL